MKAACFCETFVSTYKTKFCHKKEDHSLKIITVLKVLWGLKSVHFQSTFYELCLELFVSIMSPFLNCNNLGLI
jgi:hypothetical protein